MFERSVYFFQCRFAKIQYLDECIQYESGELILMEMFTYKNSNNEPDKQKSELVLESNIYGVI